MPELPEVETVRRRLADHVVGKQIATVDILHSKPAKFSITDVQGKKIVNVRRRSKVLILDLSDGHSLLVHLKMTGQLLYVAGKQRVGGGHPSAAWLANLPNSHTRIAWHFSDQTKLFFNDQRLFGWVVYVDSNQEQAAFAKWGPDANTTQLSTTYLQQKFANRCVPIKTALLDLQIMGGVGNIYACESLWQARISPTKPIGKLSIDEIDKLIESLQAILNKAIALGGTTFDGKYVDTLGMAGGYQNELMVYGREGKVCSHCGAVIQRFKLGGRSTFFCPICQSNY